MIIEILKEFKVEDALFIEENYDKQYLSLKELAKYIDKESFIKNVILNSIVCYQLEMKGEDYWKKFSEFFKENNDIYEFIKIYNKRLINVKIKRINKIKNFLDKLKFEDLIYYKDNLREFNDTIANIMNQNRNSKTIVFTTKMFGYSLRILGYNIIFPFDIDIPIDNRIGKISKNINFWRDISRKINIPPLHIDSIIWVTYGMEYNEIENIKDYNLKKKIYKLKNYLNSTISYNYSITNI